MNAALREGMPAVPARMQSLPVDHRGYPVPWFVAWIDGKPDFRVIGPGKIRDAVRLKKCWVCGEPVGRNMTFVIGPMCAINRTISEPPSHHDCAVFSAMACPFMALPKAKRRESNLPADTKEPAGVGLKRNPGAVLCWTTREYRLMRVDNGILFRLGEPDELLWCAEGRAATRAEVLASIDSGIHLLRDEAEKEGPDAIAAFNRMYAAGLKLVPADSPADGGAKPPAR